MGGIGDEYIHTTYTYINKNMYDICNIPARPTIVQMKALRLLAEDVIYFCSLPAFEVPDKDWETCLQGKGISYKGELVVVSRPASWAQVCPALPLA